MIRTAVMLSLLPFFARSAGLLGSAHGECLECCPEDLLGDGGDQRAGDGDGGRRDCPPTCDSCVCGALRIAVSDSARLLVPMVVHPLFVVPSGTVPIPGTADIFHVPKPLLA
jgi:hypothetical protein